MVDGCWEARSALHPARGSATPATIRTIPNRRILTNLRNSNEADGKEGQQVNEIASAVAPMIVVEGVRKSIRNGARTVDILKGLDFTVPQGEFAAIMGSSLSGKSPLLWVLARRDTPRSGNAQLHGTPV